MIELTRASFQYENSYRGVRDISLSVKGGECVVLTGLSGCGKTTVTRLVNGLAPSYYPGAFRSLQRKREDRRQGHIKAFHMGDRAFGGKRFPGPQEPVLFL